MNRHHYGLILAGGRGTRFWPRSRKRSAKQVLNVVGERSLIQATVDRLAPLIPAERLWVLTNDHLRDIIIEQLPGIPKQQILAEPEQRNTAPAIGLAAQILHGIDPEAVMGVFPSDHVIGHIPRYRAVVRAALKNAGEGRLMVVGIQPRWPETGYGYIEFPRGCSPGAADPLAVRRFHEKPVLPKARRYVKAGNFYWNSGMFFWPTGLLLEELRRHLPRTATVLASLPAFGSRRFSQAPRRSLPALRQHLHRLRRHGKGRRRLRHRRRRFRLERRRQLERGIRTAGARPCGNVIALESIALDSHNNFVDARGKLVALLGVRDLIVVDTPDALLVASRDCAQQVGDVVRSLEKRNRHDLL